jgi:hypothetical protein
MKAKTKKTSENTVIDMPEVKDIPGQEHVRPPRMREMEDTTASSDGEEGIGITDELNSEHPPVNPMDNIDNSTLDPETDVTDEEIELLDKSDRSIADDTDIAEKLALDTTDGEDPLNESGIPADLGDDLDVPGAELDDENEEIGEEDEENNPYTNRDED